jgi:hypothetical protein
MKKSVKYLGSLAFICFLGLLYSSCVKKANYPDIPAITYNGFTPFCSGAKTDSAYLRVNFTDGNGDIGYPQGQEGAPNDFFVEPMLYVATTNTYDTVTVSGSDTALKFSYTIPNITPTGSDKELNGIIQINLESLISNVTQSFSVFLPNIVYYQLEFRVWIYDRAGNKSNVLITPPVQICH